MRKGVTLMEVVAVVIIVGILAAVMIPIYSNITMKGKFAQLFSLVESYEARMDMAMAESNWNNPPPLPTSGVSIFAITGRRCSPGADAHYTIDASANGSLLCSRIVYKNGTRCWHIFGGNPLSTSLGKYITSEDLPEGGL